MNITVIYVTGRKAQSCTYNIAQLLVKELLAGGELFEFQLPRDMPHSCIAKVFSQSVQNLLQERIQMSERPNLNKELDAIAFRSFYYLKQELADLCKENGLPASGSKAELTDRIAYFLDTGNVLKSSAERKMAVNIGTLTEDTVIEPNIVCSEKHRAFFSEKIGKGVSFHVPFQKWLKANAGKTYGDAIRAHYRILEEKKQTKTEIGGQFEYNTYIRDFFTDNPGKSLHDAIVCWNYKKGLRGHHRYEQSDLRALDRQIP